MATSFIGLELGSNTTWIYKSGNGIVLKEPSLIAMTTNLKEKEIEAVGLDAQNLIGKAPANVTIFSPISNGVVAFEELAVLMLKEYLKKVFPVRSFSLKIKAILLIPLGISSEEKKQFEIVCFKAGITEVYLVPEVLSFALANNIDIKSKTSRFFVNIGSDTTNISIVSNHSIINGYNISIGGSIINVGIKKYLEDKYSIRISLEQAEELKIEVGSLYDNYNAKLSVIGINTKTQAKEQVTITSADLLPTIRYFYGKIAEAIKSIITSSGNEILSDILKIGIYYYGGATEIAGFEYFMSKIIGYKVKIIENSNKKILGTKNLINSPEELKKILKNN